MVKHSAGHLCQRPPLALHKAKSIMDVRACCSGSRTKVDVRQVSLSTRIRIMSSEIGASDLACSSVTRMHRTSSQALHAGNVELDSRQV
eukprot:scaffold3766_cov28-Prasinocladus_malaysianus.AAC.2